MAIVQRRPERRNLHVAGNADGREARNMSQKSQHERKHREEHGRDAPEQDAEQHLDDTGGR